MNNTRLLTPCRIMLIISLLALAGSAWLLLIRGASAPASDGRTAVLLNEQDRNLVLGEMRTFLAAVQSISAALSEEDMDTVASQARSVGVSTMGQVPASLMASLPAEFKLLGRSTHQAFDQIALDAEELGDPDHALKQLSETLSRCVGCHAAYRLEVRQSQAMTDALQ